MRRTKDIDWVVMGGKVGEAAYCTRCGLGLNIGNEPQPIDLYVRILEVFIDLHSKCRDEWTEPEIKTPLEWAQSRDTGISSFTIWAVMMNATTKLGRYDVPYDADDFGRCYRLLERFPQWLPRLPEVAKKHPEWTNLINQWTHLCDLYEQKQYRELNDAIRTAIGK